VVNTSEVHTYDHQGCSILPKEGMFCKVIEGGEVKIDDFVEIFDRRREN
jgi:MOSC domain-containing protein YiiM